MRDFAHLIRADETPTHCARCNCMAVVDGDGTGRRVCVACGTYGGEQVTYRTELTPAGEQMVIPGCERNAAPTVRQLDLF